MASLDRFLPIVDVRERFVRKVQAPPAVVMRTACDYDLQSLWPIRAIILARKFILRGAAEPKRQPAGLMEETRRLGWGTLVEEPDRLLICGAVCQPWLADVRFTAIPAAEFATYNTPDRVKIVWSLEAVALTPHVTQLAHEVRAVATDSEARRKFLRYWRWSRFGIITIRLLLLPAIRRRAEREWFALRAS